MTAKIFTNSSMGGVTVSFSSANKARVSFTELKCYSVEYTGYIDLIGPEWIDNPDWNNKNKMYQVLRSDNHNRSVSMPILARIIDECHNVVVTLIDQMPYLPVKGEMENLDKVIIKAQERIDELAKEIGERQAEIDMAVEKKNALRDSLSKESECHSG